MSRETLDIYDARAADYEAKNERLYERAEAEAFAAALREGGCVLDLGCGPGFYAELFQGMGLKAEAWDGSAEMVKLAQARGVAAERHMYDELEAVARYDGIWANFSLLHAPKEDFPGLLGRIRRAGKPQMVFHIGMKLGEGEGPDALGRFYAYYTEDELEGLLREAGFEVTARRHGAGPGLDGTVAKHVTMLCHG